MQFLDLNSTRNKIKKKQKTKKQKNEELKIETFDYDLKSGYIPRRLRSLTHVPGL